MEVKYVIFEEFFSHRDTIIKSKDGKIVYKEYYIYYEEKLKCILLVPDSKKSLPSVDNLSLFEVGVNIPVTCEYKYTLGFDELHLTKK